jgi:hypothetical protein
VTLFGLHRILIVAAVATGVLFAAWALFQWRTQGDPAFLALAAAGVAGGTALGLYLRWFLRTKMSKGPPPG